MKNNPMPYVLAIVILIAVVALLAVSFLFRASGYGNQAPNQNSNVNYLTISASGTVSNRSTEGIIDAMINGTGRTNEAAVQNISATLLQFNKTIYQYVNGNLSDISTNYFNVYKAYNSSNYTAMEDIEVTIPSINNVSAALGALSAIPNVYPSAISTQLTNNQISAMRVKALSLAMQNATEQARAVIGNGTITATNISVNNYYFYPYRYGLGAVPAASGAGGSYTTTVTIPPQFYGGTSQITESVTVVFSYRQG